MTIERIEVLETKVVHHGKRLDAHEILHQQHLAAYKEHEKLLDAHRDSIAALEKNTEVTTKLTVTIGNLAEALGWAGRVSKAILWIVGGITALAVFVKMALFKVLGYL